MTPAEAIREKHARELHHFEGERLLAEAYGYIQSAIATGDRAWGSPDFDWFDVRDILTKVTEPS